MWCNWRNNDGNRERKKRKKATVVNGEKCSTNCARSENKSGDCVHAITKQLSLKTQAESTRKRNPYNIKIMALWKSYNPLAVNMLANILGVSHTDVYWNIASRIYF